MKNKHLKLKFCLLAAILLCTIQITTAQKTNKRITITGTVTDINNRPVRGAVIFIDNNKTNSITNIKGHYKAKADAASERISVLSDQGAASEASIDGRTVIDFSLEGDLSEGRKESTEQETAETVSDGYHTMKKKNSTGSVSKINGQNPRYKSYQNIYEMIRGEVSGVRVIGTRIQIIGPSSIGGNDDPLFIVDGVPVDKIENISPGQVKSIEVLKGADAAIYGTRSANGVLIIKLISAEDRIKK
jgi:TonB-dependent starch-binding outer membrane protein SusC